MKTLEERFWQDVEKTASCWLWNGGRNQKGYGVIVTENAQILRAHRVAYELLVGRIPEGLVLDHLCRNRACVNPAHLEPVTHRENTLRGTSPPARNMRKTLCPKGHPLAPGNLQSSGPGWRRCLTCNREYHLAYYHRTKEVKPYYHRKKEGDSPGLINRASLLAIPPSAS